MGKKRAAEDDSDQALTAKKSKQSGSAPPKETPEGDEYWQIADKRRVTISSFKNQPLISVREYYEADGGMKPGKKGISLTVAQFSALVENLPAISASLKNMGHNIPRPNYDVKTEEAEEDEDEELNDAENDEENGKKNFEETSEEED